MQCENSQISSTCAKVELELWTEYSQWRIEKNNQILCSSSYEDKYNNQILNELIGSQITNLVILNRNDASFEFSNQMRLCIFCLDDNSNIFSIKAPTEGVITYSKKRGLLSSPSEQIVGGISNKDQELMDFTNACDRRWSTLIPKYFENHKCNECKFFIQLEGHYHFWDYGICGNEESEFDGKLVGVNSGCVDCEVVYVT